MASCVVIRLKSVSTPINHRCVPQSSSPGTIALVVGARPNFVKAAPVYQAMRAIGMQPYLIHTGQHHDARMSEAFFRVLGLPNPDLMLHINPTHNRAQQFGAIVSQLGHHLPLLKPDRVLVFGDVTSTAAAAVAADACDIPVDHVEAGLRSHDRSMPEERNRVLVDSIAHHVFVTEPSGVQHLQHEGHPIDNIHLVGNVMIDTLLAHRPHAEARAPWLAYDLSPKQYGVVTLHRPGNVDDHIQLTKLIHIVQSAAKRLPLLFPVHPRTQRLLLAHGITMGENITVTPPLDYLTFLGLMAQSQVILTDSGGIQEEATMLNVPCLVLRANTERPITLTRAHGTCTLVDGDEEVVLQYLEAICHGTYPCAPQRPPLWDGHAAERIAKIVIT